MIANKLKPLNQKHKHWGQVRHCLYPQVDNSKENFIGFHSCILLHIKF